MDEHRTYWEFNSDHARFGYMKRRIEALEREQSLMGKRVEELEARLRAENTGPIPGDFYALRDSFAGFALDCIIHDEAQVTRPLVWGEYMTGEDDPTFRMLPPEQGDEHR